jgi:hypothetical protein
MAYTKYSLTPADNNAAPPNGAPEGMLPSAVNDTMRDMMSQIRDVGDGIRGGTYTMTAPVITGGSISGSTMSSNVITGGSINNTPIGASTANTGAFTTLGASGVATFSAGSVSAPAITTTGDTNTGIFFPAADTIAFTEGGVESMRITSAGNVGIGTNNPSASLDIVSNSGALAIALRGRSSDSISDLSFRSNDAATIYGQIQGRSTDLRVMGVGAVPITFFTNSVEHMRINGGGLVGIGSNNPAAKLDVDNGTAANALTSYFTKGNSDANFRLGFYNGTGTTSFSQQAALVFDYVGVDNLAKIGFNRGNSANCEAITFSIGGTGASTERMRINNLGNVGIGTNDPAGKLDILTGTNRGYFDDSAGSLFRLNAVTATNSAYAPLSLNGSILTFQTSAAERMRIDSVGNLGIGTSSLTSSRLQAARSSGTAYNDSQIEAIATGGGNVLISFHSAGVSAVCLRHQSNVEAIQARNLVDTAFIAFQASAFTVVSDYRLKENVVPLNGALDRLSSLPVHRFNFRPPEEVGDNYGAATVDGFLAHEVAKVVPEAAFGEKDAVKEDGSPLYQSVDLAKLVPLLAASIKELKSELDSVKAELQTLKGS